MGFWHTGYMEFHEEPGLPEPGPREAHEYPCPHCGVTFLSVELLRQHRFDQHPYVTPQLLIRGLEAGKTTVRLTSEVTPTDFAVERTDGALLNGRPVELGLLPSLLSALRQDRVTLTLRNSGASSDFDLVFAIPDHEHVDAVETAFMRLARGKTLSLQAIEGFIADCTPYESASEYCDGICSYLYGVLAKEKAPETAIPYERYTDKFNQAISKLKDYDRPLSRMVRGLVSFHFNHFEEAARIASHRLRAVTGAYVATLSGLSWPPTLNGVGHEGIREDMLTDHETLRILQWAATPLPELQREVPEIESFLKKDIPEYDKFKLKILLAELYASEDYIEKARRLARELLSNTRSRSWAEHLMNRLDTVESSNE